MNDVKSRILELAVARGFITKVQADLLNEELFMFPGGNIMHIMLRRAMVTPDQARELETIASSQGETTPSINAADDLLDVDAPTDFSVKAQHFDSLAKEPLFPDPILPPLPKGTGPGAAVPLQPRPSISAAVQRSIAAAATPRPQAPVLSRPLADILPDPTLMRYLKAARDRGASDLHLSPGLPPYVRKDGKILFLNEPPLSAEQCEKLNLSVLTHDQKKHIKNHLQIDFAFDAGLCGRLRANVYCQRLGYEGAYRLIPAEVPTLESLGLPLVLEKLTTYTQGLNLVTGPGGCGKTSTVAAMLEHINQHRHEHIITVEDPVEYIFNGVCCQITQREVGTHTESFNHALRTALRQDPDVIMIGELRDLETTSISITAAETGHLVFGTLHTSSAIRTVARILDVYPPAQRAQICLMVAESLRGIISQQLIERKDGNGRACAMEVLLVTTGVSQVIKEGKTHQLVSHMQSGRKMGMISMDDALMELFKSGTISGREAYARAENKNDFEPTKWQS